MLQLACGADFSSGPVLDVARVDREVSIDSQLRAICGQVGRRPTAIAGQYMRLFFGRGRVSFADFVKLRLFDPTFHDGAQLGAFVGQRRNRDICVTANYRHDWLSVLSNKMVSLGYLSGYGLPTIPVSAVFAPHMSVEQRPLLGDRKALEAFLLTSSAYPLFCKPVEGLQSLGSIALRGVMPKYRELERVDGTTVDLDVFISDIETHYRTGYLFQPLVRPEASIARLCGDRLACVRVITAATEDGPQILRACFKIPGGPNCADNYWRPGNLLAQVDLSSGRLLRSTSGCGLAAKVHFHHPDTRVPIEGFEIPHWRSVKALAIEGATLMQNVPLIGWDIACTDHGPVIVEMNETPDFFLVQFADRRGMMDPDFEAFLAYQARNASQRLRYMKASIAKL